MKKHSSILCILAIFFFQSVYADCKEQATFSIVTRLLMLDGDDGSVACRIYGNLMSSTIPKFSDKWNLECATRSLLRMKNLTAVRGERLSSMIGPVDYLGNLEEPHKYLYTIDNGDPPVFYRWPINTVTVQQDLHPFDDSLVTIVKAIWISGLEKDQIKRKIEEYSVIEKDLCRSLFLHPGFLEIDTPVIELRYFDPREIDLSSFKAKLFKNDSPFQITKKKLPAKDDYRLVTYLYEPHYADWQVEHGSGLFLEKHEFSQTMTPINEDSTGFVALARTNRNGDELELIAIEIPFGWTLLIEEGCIHGDTTLNGFFMMGMTSDHTTMRTANTVFLKCTHTKRNVKMNLDSLSSKFPEKCSMPHVLYYDATTKELDTFYNNTKGKSFIFNPFSRGYWKTNIF